MRRKTVAGVALAALALATTGAAPGPARPRAYMIAQLHVKDAAAFQIYAPKVQATLDPFGGRYLARGGATVALEGAAPADRVVIIEFPDIDAARAHWASDAYRAITPLRRAAAEGSVFLVEGAAP